MAGLIGKKIGMTSLYDDKGNNLACTVIQAGPCVVTQIKNIEKDGYTAVQVGFDDKKERLVTKSELGHFKNSKQSPKAKLMEFSNYESELKVGDVLSADLFVEGEYVDVTGVSKGKGFQGVVKRHGFAGVGQSTHGQHNRLRAPGSIGAASYPARVFKGMKMAGQTGNENVTVQNLKVVKVITEKNINKTDFSKALDFKRNLSDYKDQFIYHHIGIYGFTNEALMRYVNLERSKLEKERNLEQMRALENKMNIHVGYTPSNPLSVDTNDDLEEVKKIMEKK